MKNNQIKRRREIRWFFRSFNQIQKRSNSLWILFSLLFLILPVKFQAQPVESNKVPKTNKVPIKVPIIVTDREGRRISGLKKDDFSLFQNEVKQNITSFGSNEEPISIALLIDTSGSTQSSLSKIKEAAGDFIDILNPNDQCLIATFDSEVKILNPLTADRKTLKKSLEDLQTGAKEGTVMFNAVSQVVRNSLTRATGRKAVVLLSDGKDYGSSVTKKDLLSELEESDLSVYAIYYQSGIGFSQPVINETGTVAEAKPEEKPKKVKKPKPRKKGYTIFIPLPGETLTQEDVRLIDKTMTTEALTSLKEMTDLTAGRLYMSDAEKLSAIFKQVAGELRQVYLIGFEGSTINNVAQNITVKVDRPGVVVNTRHNLVN